jgi:predicted Zn-dependent peptidase
MQDDPFPLYRTTLANGLRVWCQPRPDSESVAALLVLEAGSRHETAADNGVSHFVEHMLFTGTERWSEEEIKDVLTRRGGRWNGWTGTEQTTYFAHVAAGDLGIALDWLAELVFHATFPADKVDKERQVIFQERWGRYGWLINTLDALGFGYELDRDVRRALFPGSSLGLRIVGEDASLERLDRAALLDYYQRHYTPANAVLIVVGGVTAEQVLDGAKGCFGDLKGERRPAEPDPPTLPATGPQQIVVRGPMPTAQVTLMVGARTVGHNHADRWALEVLAELLDKDLSEEIRYRRGLVYGLGEYNVPFADAGYFNIYTTADRQDREAIQQIIGQHLDRLRQGEVRAEAISEAKAALQGRWALTMEDNVERATWLAQWPAVLAGDEPVPDYRASIAAVTTEDVSRVVGIYFVPQRSYVGLHQPVVTVASGARLVGAALALGLGLWGVRRFRRRAENGPDRST